ncbi:putative F-box/FBD/LRR-repeat protein At5g44950 [Raphanus sativus]|uniref:F-box/FBD/LRR-repeat protein At5g44950 n=1 Tax=Raphanus sativus TaxID=3726 RepID=A0A9W3CHB2_RAPSA|nr:putative F-box/FBD/LRR-repeat protein At5g44950 [Raphanus sativus]
MGYDRISALPDHLITEILLWLLTGDSVKTSLLSTRWRNLWLDVPGLDFKLPFTNTKASFIERFLEFNRDARLRKFKLTYHRCKPNKGHPFGIREWIATAISRGAQHLEVVEIFDTSLKNKLEFMPLDIYKSKTLVSLNLVRVGMSDPDFVVFLPCLKNMYLEQIMCSGKDPSFMEKLISGCPVLEGLTVSRSFDDNVLVLRVRSKSLKRFSVWSDWIGTNGREFALEIDAPGLKYMDLGDHLSQRIVVKNLRSLFMIDIDSIFNAGSDTNLKMKKDAIGDFLNGISRVRHMIISQYTMEVFNRYLGSIPTFNNLYRLEASCNTSCNTHLLQVLPDFLESFPNLRHLTLCT